MPTYLPFDPNPRRPSKLPPAKSIDSQFHVLGPLDKYPVRPGAAYQMPSATWEAALRVHKALGIERGIIVQTTTYGADHSVVLDGLAAPHAAQHFVLLGQTTTSIIHSSPLPRRSVPLDSA